MAGAETSELGGISPVELLTHVNGPPILCLPKILHQRQEKIAMEYGALLDRQGKLVLRIAQPLLQPNLARPDQTKPDRLANDRSRTR